MVCGLPSGTSSVERAACFEFGVDRPRADETLCDRRARVEPPELADCCAQLARSPGDASKLVLASDSAVSASLGSRSMSTKILRTFSMSTSTLCIFAWSASHRVLRSAYLRRHSPFLVTRSPMPLLRT